MYHYTSCGLRGIWLRNGYTETKTSYGKGVAIHDIEGLHEVIGIYFVKNKPRLSGAEVRFLRKELDLSQLRLAEVLGVGESSVRGWENHRTKITLPADRLLRLIYLETIEGDGIVRKLVDRLSLLDTISYSMRCEMEETDVGWKKAA